MKEDKTGEYGRKQTRAQGNGKGQTVYAQQLLTKGYAPSPLPINVSIKSLSVPINHLLFNSTFA